MGSGSGSRSGLCQKAWRPHPWCWGRGNRSDLTTSPITRGKESRERLSNESVKHSGIMNYGMFRPRSHSKAGSSKWVAIILVFPSLLCLLILLYSWEIDFKICLLLVETKSGELWPITQLQTASKQWKQQNQMSNSFAAEEFCFSNTIWKIIFKKF